MADTTHHRLLLDTHMLEALRPAADARRIVVEAGAHLHDASPELRAIHAAVAVAASVAHMVLVDAVTMLGQDPETPINPVDLGDVADRLNTCAAKIAMAESTLRTLMARKE